MSDSVFVDTNILVYSRDASEPEKQPLALACLEELWREQRGRISVQVLSEYYVTVTRKLTPGLPPEEAWADVSALMAWEPIVIDGALLRVARDVEARYGLSWWDAMIIAAASEAGCATVYSEDLSDGQMYAGVQVVNPLADAQH